MINEYPDYLACAGGSWDGHMVWSITGKINTGSNRLGFRIVLRGTN